MAINYQHTIRAQLKTAIISMLGDLDSVHFTNLDIDQVIEEALLTFGAVSGFWKEQIFLNTAIGKTLYNLITDSTINKERIAFSITYQKLLDWINRDLEENISTLNLTSDITSLTEILNLIDDSIDLFNRETSLVLDIKSFPITPDISIVELADNVLDIVRVEFLDENNSPTLLYKDDEESISYSSESSLSNQGPPEFFTELFLSNKSIRIYPRPNVPGALRVIYVIGIDRSSNQDSNTRLKQNIQIPNNLVPYLKYRIMWKIFGNNELAVDPGRENYCLTRWQEGLSVGKFYASALKASVNDRTVYIDSLNKVDQFSTPEIGSPTLLGFAGYNMFGVDTIPDNNYSISVDANVNANIPIADSDFIDTRIEYIDCITNYCVHLLVFKDGITDINENGAAKEMFLQTAISHNKRLQQLGYTYSSLFGKTKQQISENDLTVSVSSDRSQSQS